MPAVAAASWLAAFRWMTGLEPVAVVPVVAGGIRWRVRAAIRCLVAGVDGATHGVGTRGAAGYAAGARVASLLSVAELRIVAAGVVRDVYDLVYGVVAEICGAADPVVAVDGGARQAAQGCIADFDAIAVGTVAAERVNGVVVYRVGGFIAKVGRAGDSVVQIRAWIRYAALTGIAGFGTIAVALIVAGFVIWHMAEFVERLVAAVERAGESIVAVWRRDVPDFANARRRNDTT